MPPSGPPQPESPTRDSGTVTAMFSGPNTLPCRLPWVSNVSICVCKLKREGGDTPCDSAGQVIPGRVSQRGQNASAALALSDWLSPRPLRWVLLPGV